MNAPGRQCLGRRFAYPDEVWHCRRMKPANWNELSKEAQVEYATNLLNSPRGFLMISQALVYGATVARGAGEISNAEDMDLIAETLFSTDGPMVHYADLSVDSILSDDDD